MTPKDPQFLYMILVLPSLFGLTLMGEGMYKCAHEEWGGLISVFFGMLFIGMVVFAYLFFSSYMLGKV
ncbi:MAG: hypothetical protein ACD_19C00182G0080 [uncultured bacterium]|nr:MAG: hypothetical protein ACD_19C00182G0080 [uncultured bacterium]